ncbi:MAG: glycosyltransferase family 1 protein [bacterium]|nr:glycosyltransferase family 1 protein [bacterium]
MLKIGIDARLYFQTGVGVYTRNLLHYLDKINPKGIKFIAYVLKKDIKKISQKNKNITFRGVNSKWHTFSEQTIFLKNILNDNLDLMHFTYFSYPILYPKKFIATVHDTTLLKFKTGKASTKSSFIYNFKYMIFKHVFKNQIKRSLSIITPTESVKKQLLNICPYLNKEKVTAIYEGVTYEYLKVKVNKNISDKYFLYVGTFYPHKNVENLLRAFSKLKTSIKLYLVGPDDFFLKKIENLITSLDLKSKIKIIRNVHSSELPDLYANAQALIHPSKSEGFGLPLIESAYFGTQIIASDIDVFAEILGSNYISFNPNDINDIREKLQYFIDNEPHFDYKGLLQKFSFEKMTIKTLDLYKKILKI